MPHIQAAVFTYNSCSHQVHYWDLGQKPQCVYKRPFTDCDLQVATAQSTSLTFTKIFTASLYNINHSIEE